MSVTAEQLPITSPCPITLDRSGISAQDRRMFCEHCTKDVHLLSQMSETEARALMTRESGRDICVSYAQKSDGSIRFRTEPALVPVAALRRGPAFRPAPVHAGPPRSLTLGFVLGASMFLAACTPHSEPEVVGGIEAPAKVEEPAPEVEPCEPEREREPRAGGLRAEPLPPPEMLVDGGMIARPLPEDAPPEPPPKVKKVDRPRSHKRGGIRARPVPRNQDPLADL